MTSKGTYSKDDSIQSSVETDAHFIESCRYIVLKPVRAGICADPGEYRWSSYRATAANDRGHGLLAVAIHAGEALREQPDEQCGRKADHV